MSRRKQARPIRHLESEDGLVAALPNGESSGSGSEDEGEEARPALCLELDQEPDPEDEDSCGPGGKRLLEARRQDQENNNGGAEELAGGFPFPLAPGHVTLEALQNTKVAVAQFAATTMANNADNAAALQELAVLQSTLFTLQHQQVMQLSLIQQLQQQLQITRSKEGSPVSPPPAPVVAAAPPPPPPPPPPAARAPSPAQEPPPPPTPASQSLPPSLAPPAATKPPPPPPSPPAPPPLPPQMAMCSISSSLAASIITNNDPMPLHEPNTLEMLQRRAQEVLDNASQGLLANNLADELAFRKSGKSNSLSPYDSKSGGRNEPFFKHRCRYCGKVFGSDSALQIHIRSHTVRPGNTTCNICFKTFACNSALEIHYRSHTKERPFKCTVCDRGFSTKGNMKQHMLTHKIRDMPSHLFETNKPPPPPIPSGNPLLEEGNHLEESRPLMEHPSKLDLGVKRSPPEGEALLPIPKRQPGLPKHLCHVCNKNFSSSSALQIHMRTHTGDKPFRCTICQKAFTTKGNLKVHMGTHMWSNGASRRGRRMSLDLPPIPMTPKDSEFLQRRPDLFYPYLPAPFLNGMQQKLNEISVIQSVNSNSRGLSPPGGKYAGVLGFGGYPGDKSMIPEPLRSQPGSPLSDRPPSSVSSPPPLSLSLGSHHGSPPLREPDGPERGVWDLHYEQKPSLAGMDEPMDVSPSPVPHPPPTPRGEGLAA